MTFINVSTIVQINQSEKVIELSNLKVPHNSTNIETFCNDFNRLLIDA